LGTRAGSQNRFGFSERSSGKIEFPGFSARRILRRKAKNTINQRREKQMQIDIQTRGFNLSRRLEQHIRRKLSNTLAAQSDHITHAQVRLSDINGPRGGVDKCCQLNVKLAGSPSVVVRDVSTSMYAAIDCAAHRISSSLSRRLSRLRSPRRPSRKSRAQIFDKTSFTA
jgi:ribosome-associated translation inhibitor RaiA